jgi:hypothetical protein
VKATKRVSHGLSFLSAFTWSRNLVNGSETVPTPGSTGNAQINDVFNRPNNRYLSAYDAPYAWNIFGELCYDPT